MKSQVPAILASPAYQQDCMLVITFDEALPRLAGAGEPGVNTFGTDVYRSGP